MNKGLGKIFSEIYKDDKKNISKALFTLRSRGCTQLESIKIIMNEVNLTLAEADKIILNSESWKDLRDPAIRLRDEFDKGLTED